MTQNKQPGQAHQEQTPQRGQEHGHVRQVQERERHDRDQLGHEKHQAGQMAPKEQYAQPKDTQAAQEKTGVTVYIDHKPYHAASKTFSGAELRQLSIPPIGPDKDLFRVVSGNGDDIKIGDADVIAIDMRETHQGRHFFSDTIEPSKDEVDRRAYFIYQEQGCQPGHDAENWSKAEAQIKSRHKES